MKRWKRGVYEIYKQWNYYSAVKKLGNLKVSHEGPLVHFLAAALALLWTIMDSLSTFLLALCPSLQNSPLSPDCSTEGFFYPKFETLPPFLKARPKDLRSTWSGYHSSCLASWYWLSVLVNFLVLQQTPGTGNLCFCLCKVLVLLTAWGCSPSWRGRHGSRVSASLLRKQRLRSADAQHAL